MNWLAHVALSEPSARFRVGNILPDILGLRDLAPLGPEYQRGIACHRAIDIFTDGHPVFARSRRRFHASHRRCAAILVDVFYDHLLARTWLDYFEQPLSDCVDSFYESLVAVQDELPVEMHALFNHLRSENWLGSNSTLDGPRGAIMRVERRLRGRVDLSGAVPHFLVEANALAGDFLEFFPDVISHVRGAGFAVATSEKWRPQAATGLPPRPA